jgi:fructokinase
MLWDCLAEQAGVPVEQVTAWNRYPGGAPANVACALVKLGTSAGFIGCIGNDAPGDALVELLRTTGVNTVGIQRHNTAPTRQIEVLRSLTGDRQFAGFMGHDTTEFADTRLQADQLPVELFDGAEVLVLGTLEFAYSDTRQAIEKALVLAEQCYLKILLDVNWRPMFWPHPEPAKLLIQELAKSVDFLKLSDDEAEWLFETTDPGVIAHRLGNAEAVLITSGERGCAYYLSDNAGTIPAFKVEVEDTTGAGDSFVAGFLHQLCQRGIQALSDPTVAREVILYASAVGALTASRTGAIAAQPTAAEVDAFLYLNQHFGHQ